MKKALATRTFFLFLAFLFSFPQHNYALTSDNRQQRRSSTLLRLPLVQRYSKRSETNNSHNSVNNENLKSTIVLVDSHSYYSIDIQIGNPPQNIPVLLDTGSADLWVPGIDCPSTVCKSKKFNRNNSRSFASFNETFEIHYAVGYASGYLAQDIVTAGQATVSAQEFGYVIDIVNITGTIGTLGLGFPNLAESYRGYLPFMYGLFAQHTIQKHVFSIYLHDGQGTTGEIIFGGIDNSKHNGDLHFMDLTKTKAGQLSHANGVDQYGFWQVAGLSIGVKRTDTIYTSTVASSNSKKKAESSSASRSTEQTMLEYTFGETEESDFKFDTGTTYTYLNPILTQNIVMTSFAASDAKFNEQNRQYEVTCTRPYYSNIIIQFGMSPGLDKIDGRPIILSTPLSDFIRPKNGNSTDDATRCIFGIAPTLEQDGETSIIIGLSALRSLYLVFDTDQAQIGIASVIGSQAFVTRDSQQIGIVSKAKS
ncbi:MAG: aspartic peptidase domain-containing protein [Benjaminiella poitrasii]|nr:MAG: aspartic peptidase domain-containing protein [Benjaminiella poitrasii]